MAATGAPVVFVHGMFLHAGSWGGWAELFRATGYDPVTPGWPGEPSTVAEARQQPDRVAGNGIDDIVAHYAKTIRALDTRPIVIGHSTGALVAQRLLGQNLAAAVVAIQPPPIKGVVSLALSTVPVGWVLLRNPANRRRALSLTARQFRYSHGNARLSRALFCRESRAHRSTSRAVRCSPATGPNALCRSRRARRAPRRGLPIGRRPSWVRMAA